MNTYIEITFSESVPLEEIDTLREDTKILYKLSSLYNEVYLTEKTRVSSGKYVLFNRLTKEELSPFSSNEEEYRRISLLYQDDNSEIDYDERKLIYIVENASNEEWTYDQLCFLCVKLRDSIKELLPEKYELKICLNIL